MTDWLSYSLTDFLLFAPRTYYRLLALYNADLWPLHLAVVAAGAAILVIAFCSRPAWLGRVIAAILVAAWLLVATASASRPAATRQACSEWRSTPSPCWSNR
jgi:hypothetical protein